MILSLIISILTLVAEWMIFKKMGRQGWEGIVPFYNTYVLCQELYGNGWKFLLLLIPIYNIYFVIKMNIDWAKAFNQGVGFGIGLLLLSGWQLYQYPARHGGECGQQGQGCRFRQPGRPQGAVTAPNKMGQENILSHFFMYSTEMSGKSA